MSPMPDLFPVVQALTDAAFAGVQAVVADAAQQVVAGAPPMPQLPAPVPAQPAPLAWPDTRGLNEVIINLGGWAAILKWVFSSVANKIDARFVFFEVRIKRIERSLNNLVAELRRLRHAPPLKAYEDDDPPSPAPAARKHRRPVRRDPPRQAPAEPDDEPEDTRPTEEPGT